jgi:hypothetical protein
MACGRLECGGLLTSPCLLVSCLTPSSSIAISIRMLLAAFLHCAPRHTFCRTLSPPLHHSINPILFLSSHNHTVSSAEKRIQVLKLACAKEDTKDVIKSRVMETCELMQCTIEDCIYALYSKYHK